MIHQVMKKNNREKRYSKKEIRRFIKQSESECSRKAEKRRQEIAAQKHRQKGGMLNAFFLSVYQKLGIFDYAIKRTMQEYNRAKENKCY